MKKILTYVLIIMILAIGMFVLTGCSNNEKNGGIETLPENQDVSTIEVVPTTDYTKWPEGVFGAYGIPEYKNGTHAFSVPGIENGSTFIKTTYSDFKSYIDELLNKGFRMSQEHKDAVEYFNDTDKNEYNSVAVELYDPQPGKGYVIEVEYFAKERTQEVFVGEYEGIEEELSFEFNFLIWVDKKEYPEEMKDTELLTKYGISDDVVVPDFKTYTIEKYEDDKGRININIDSGYDYEFSEKDINEYKTRLANEILKISDDGKMYDMSGKNELVSEDDKLIGYYLFKYQGSEYRCYCEVKPGFNGGRMAVGIEPR